jgi:hypothetical protein
VEQILLVPEGKDASLCKIQVLTRATFVHKEEFMEHERKDKVIAVRVTPKQYAQVKELVKEKYITASTLGRVLIEMYLRQEVQI